MNNLLHWRYATKKFDPTRKVSQEALNELLEVLRLSPSSFGLQPWKFVVVEDPHLRQEIRKHAWNQSQVTDASHLIILCSIKNIDETYIKNFVGQIAKSRNVEPQSLAGYQQMMIGAIQAKDHQEVSNWMKRQVYLALGMLLYACAQKGIDSCPMEGFDAKKVDEVLGLEKEGLESVVFCPVGYRASDDVYAHHKKARFEQDEILIKR